MLQAIDRAEVDMQIATAKQYPRDLTAVLNKISTYATMDKETAEECFYVLRRENQRGETTLIEGLSVRMAEIIASSWGNLRVATRIIGNDGKTITAQAICHDLESNFAVSKNVQRRITTKNGKTYSEDMQIVTGNAAASIAFRNAVLAVIPKAMIKKIINETKKVAMGQSIDLESARQNVIAYYGKLGVKPEQLLAYLGVKTTEEIDKAMIFELRALRNAIEEGTTTVKETFTDREKEAQAQAEAVKKASSAKDKAQAALAAATGAAAPSGLQDDEQVDPETGEVTKKTTKK
jgi:GTP:adenosylcobinamide-phosphate guanylyltransferase